jgi:hypothetical protein
MQNQTLIQCSACHHPFEAAVYTYINAEEDPDAKYLLVTGRLNYASCPQCQTPNTIATPLLYHDPTKELLIAYVPMELNLTKDAQEKAIGDLMNKMPKTDFKGYMFNPRRALTLQGIVDQILEADGVTPEELEKQRQRVELAQKLLESTNPEELVAAVKENDAQIDENVFQVINIMAQRAMEDGRQDLAQGIMMKQSLIAESSTFGKEFMHQQEEKQKIAEEVAVVVQKFDEDVTREDFLKLALLYVDKQEHLEALVGLVRPAFDYEFFQILAGQVENANGKEKKTLDSLRESLLELTSAIDKQTQAMMQNAAAFLQAVIGHPQPEQMLRANLPMLDDTLMAVLAANIQQAEKAENQQALDQLTSTYNLIMQILQENMQPELRFINELLMVEDQAEVQTIIREQAGQFGDGLFEVFDAVEQVLKDQGNQEMVERLRNLRLETQQLVQ